MIKDMILENELNEPTKAADNLKPAEAMVESSVEENGNVNELTKATINRREIAKTLFNRGISFIPIKADGSKAPAFAWKEFQRRKPIQPELNDWFGSGSNFGIAIVCGPVSGNLELLDFDEPSVYPQWCELIKDEDTTLLDKLTIIKTPSGGFHALYQCASIKGNQKLAQRLNKEQKSEVLIETRGEGGYALTVGSPPECHPALKQYEFIQGSFESIPIISEEERELLLDCARQFDEVIKPRRTVFGKTTNENNRPGDDYNSRTTWDEILISAGWKLVREVGDAKQWSKPNKKGIGISATTNHNGSDLLYVFSTNAPPFESECAYTKFAAYALLGHSGDYSAAAKDLASKGFGDNSFSSAEGNQEIDWTNPDSFGDMLPFGEIEGNEISTAFLPKWVKDYVDAVAAHTQVEPGAVAVLALAVLAACVQMRFEVCVSPGYTETLSLWVFLALPPASRKSAVFQALIAPVIEWEQQEAKRLQPEIAKEQTEIAVTNERIKELTRMAGKAEE